MTKPFPCCQCACVYCPDEVEEATDWEFIICSIAFESSFEFVSSNTGNRLDVDINALTAITFQFDDGVTGSEPKVGTNNSVLLGLTGPYVYRKYDSVGGNYQYWEYNDIALAIIVEDNCGDIRIYDVGVRSESYRFGTGTSDPSSVTWGSYVAGEIHYASDPGSYDGCLSVYTIAFSFFSNNHPIRDGSVLAKKKDETSPVCPEA